MTTGWDFGLAADEAFFPGLAAAVCSIVDAVGRESAVRLHIMDGGLSDASWQGLEELVRRRHECAELRRVQCDLGAFRGAAALGREGSEFGSKGLMPYARLLFPEVLDASVETLIYVDCDVLFRLSPGPLAGIIRAPCVAAAVAEANRVLADDCPWLAELGLDGRAPYFNTGVMVIDLAAWREAGVLERARALIETGKPLAFWDQTILNALLAGRIQALGEEWNVTYGQLPQEASHDLGQRYNIHLSDSVKPWQALVPDPRHDLFHSYAEEIGLRRYCPYGRGKLRWFLHRQRVSPLGLRLRRLRAAARSWVGARARGEGKR